MIAYEEVKNNRAEIELRNFSVIVLCSLSCCVPLHNRSMNAKRLLHTETGKRLDKQDFVFVCHIVSLCIWLGTVFLVTYWAVLQVGNRALAITRVVTIRINRIIQVSLTIRPHLLSLHPLRSHGSCYCLSFPSSKVAESIVIQPNPEKKKKYHILRHKTLATSSF